MDVEMQRNGRRRRGGRVHGSAPPPSPDGHTKNEMESSYISRMGSRCSIEARDGWKRWNSKGRVGAGGDQCNKARRKKRLVDILMILPQSYPGVFDSRVTA